MSSLKNLEGARHVSSYTLHYTIVRQTVATAANIEAGVIAISVCNLGEAAQMFLLNQ